MSVYDLFIKLENDKVISRHDYWTISEFTRHKSDDIDTDGFQEEVGSLGQWLSTQLRSIREKGVAGKAVGEFTKAELLREIADNLFDQALCENGGDVRELPE